MRAGSRRTLPLLLAPAGMAIAPLLAWAWQANAPPPAIAHDGITNLASQMPPEFGGGALARGSLFRIRGWRLGPAIPVKAQDPLKTSLAGMSVQIRSGGKRADAFLLLAGDNQIEALLPSGAPLGQAEIIVSKDGDPSEPIPVRIVESSFGAFSTNQSGWGPGEIRKGSDPDSPADSVEQPARPGETITLTGTGLGPPQAHPAISITVAGQPVTRIRFAGPSKCCRGQDELSFDLPSQVPDGCYVPVRVQSAPGIVSNVVTFSISRDGNPCRDPGNWLPREIGMARRTGIVALVNADVLLYVDGQRASFDFDAGLARFFAIPAGPVEVAPFYLFPPLNTCTAYTRMVQDSEILSSFGSMEAARGVSLDAGPAIAARTGNETRTMALAPRSGRGFAGVLGGRSPFPGAPQSPLFLRPQLYELSGAGGADAGAFRAVVPVSKPVRWINRAQVSRVDRSEGVRVEWAAAHAEDVIVIDAMNLDGQSGALGVSECVAPARAGTFTIPAGQLINIPPTRAGGLPLNLLSISEFPGTAPVAFHASGIDRGFGFFFSVSARTVDYR